MSTVGEISKEFSLIKEMILDVRFSLIQEIELYRDLQNTLYVDIFHEKAACLKKIALLRKNLNSLRKIKKLIVNEEYENFTLKNF